MPQATDPCQPAISSKLIAGFTTNYDKAGNKLYERHLHSECRSHSYQMDTANRLSKYQRGKLTDPQAAWPATAPAPSTSLGLPKAMSQVQYDLDLMGNWNPTFTPADGSASPASTSTYNPLNQLTARGNSFTYDPNGNLLNDGKLQYEYDAINRLKRVYQLQSGSVPKQLLVEYWYDALGRRIKRDIKDLGGGAGGITGTVKAGVTYFSYAGQQCVEEREGTNTSAPARQYIWGHYVDELVQQREYNTPTGPCDLYPIQDLHNRTVALTDPSGSIIEAYDTDAYGRTLIFNDPGLDATWFSDDDHQVPAPRCRFLYTGREYDAETGLYFYRARYYSSELGRFTQRDPVGFAGGNSNLYCFVGAKPTLNMDPTGLYDSAGHFYTVYLVAVAAGYSARESYRLAYYAQLPDQNRRFDAESMAGSTTLQFLNPFDSTETYNKQRNAYNLLHDLAGGDLDDIERRRERILAFLNNPAAPLQVWETGFAIHRLGDNHAHREPVTGGGFTFPLGHALYRHKPDNIATAPDEYYRYVLEIYSILAKTSPNFLPSRANPILEALMKARFAVPNDGPAQRKYFKNLAVQYGYPANGYDPDAKEYAQDPTLHTPSNAELSKYYRMIGAAVDGW